MKGLNTIDLDAPPIKQIKNEENLNLKPKKEVKPKIKKERKKKVKPERKTKIKSKPTKKVLSKSNELNNIRNIIIIVAIAFLIVVLVLLIAYNISKNEMAKSQQEQKEIALGSEQGLTEQGKKYLDDNIEKTDTDVANQLIIDYEKNLKDKKREYEKIFSENNYYDIFTDYFNGYDNSYEAVIDRITNEEHKKIVKSIYNDGLKVVVAKNSRAYPIIDYERIEEEYGDRMYDSLRKYISVKALAVSNPVVLGNKLQLSIDDLGLRLIKIEEVVYEVDDTSKDPNKITIKSTTKKKIDEQILNELLEVYKMYYLIYIKGESSYATHEIFDEEGTIKPEVLNSYNGIIESYPDMELTKGLKNYVKWLKSNNNTVTKEELEAYLSLDTTIENIKINANIE